MQKTARIALTLAALVVCFIGMTWVATAAPGWRYKQSHGMTNCVFATYGPGGGTVNVATTATTPGGVTIAGEQGSSVTLRLVCARKQMFDDQGQLTSIGPEGNYSGPGGPGTPVGVDTPAQRAAGYSFPKGREWTVPVGPAPQTHQLSWSGELGSDAIAVTVQPVAPPPSLPQVQQIVQPVQQRADDAYQLAELGGKRGWEKRTFALTGYYMFDSDSFGTDASPRQGLGLDFNLMFGGDPNIKFLTGLTLDLKFREKPVTAAPNQPVNGFNSFVDWKTVFIGPVAGFDWMPASFFALQGWGSLGALLSIDGTLPLTQLPDGTLYSQESQTQGAFGYKAMVNANFVIAEHFVVGPSVGLEGNISTVTTEAGPEVYNDGAGNQLRRRDGHFIDFMGALRVGGMW